MMTLTKSSFIEWLLENKNKTVGFCGDSDRCPLGSWIKEVTGQDVSIRGVWKIEIGGKRVPYEEVPDWFVDVLDKIDTIGLPGGRIRGKNLIRRLVV